MPNLTNNPYHIVYAKTSIFAYNTQAFRKPRFMGTAECRFRWGFSVQLVSHAGVRHCPLLLD
jgi:hypothetical protein